MIHKAIIHIMYNPPVSSTVVTRSQLVPTQLLPFVQAQWNQIIYEATFEQSTTYFFKKLYHFN